LILAIAVAAWRRRRARARSAALETALLGVVVFQAALGMWTVTLLLKPVIVTLHLMGGMTTLALATWLALREIDVPRAPAAAPARLRPWALAGLAVVAVQIALGGWVSSNYAALACVDFPTCHGAWLPEMDFRHGFQFLRELGRTADGGHLAYEALTAIHWTHRVGALVTFLFVGGLAVALWRRGAVLYGGALGAVLALQVGLGIANIVAGLPLAVAVAHNAVAALLLVTLVVINFGLSRRTSIFR
ncbi:MAG TPA: COX15/CtaA family protein, partial [Burkholderiales bacterium]|nr:COX15/CtaA family protein [Burkholderiales bacterium]